MKTGGRSCKSWSLPMGKRSSVSLNIIKKKQKILNSYPAPEECKRRIVKTEEDKEDLEADVSGVDDSEEISAEGNDPKENGDQIPDDKANHELPTLTTAPDTVTDINGDRKSVV